MPIMSGVDAIRKLRELGWKDFVVGVTGNAMKEDQEGYLAAGINAYVHVDASPPLLVTGRFVHPPIAS